MLICGDKNFAHIIIVGGQKCLIWRHNFVFPHFFECHVQGSVVFLLYLVTISSLWQEVVSQNVQHDGNAELGLQTGTSLLCCVPRTESCRVIGGERLGNVSHVVLLVVDVHPVWPALMTHPLKTGVLLGGPLLGGALLGGALCCRWCCPGCGRLFKSGTSSASLQIRNTFTIVCSQSNLCLFIFNPT